MADLHQSKVWTDAYSVDHPIETMDRRHAANVIAMLERNARGIVFRDSLAMFDMLTGPGGPQGEMAFDILDREIQQEDAEKAANPLGWLRRTPLLRALQKRVDSPPSPGEEYPTLPPGLGDPFEENL